LNLVSFSLAAASVIELLTAGVVIVHAAKAIFSIRAGGSDAARLILAQGVLAALGFSLAATLLKVIGLSEWVQIRTFTVVFVLRTLLKLVFLGEAARIQKRGARTLIANTLHSVSGDRRGL